MTSAGQLLRMLKDCEIFHIESALASLQQETNVIKSQSLLKPTENDNINMLKRTNDGRVLTLSDHKRIARLQAALKLIVNAYEAQDEKKSAESDTVNRNVLHTVTGAVMMQSLSDCTASKINGCIWGPQGKKLQFLLDWIINRENDRASSTHDYGRQLLLKWIQPAAEKQHQLAACLTLFELLQRHRSKFQNISDSTTVSCLVGSRAEMFLNALHGVVDRGTIRAASSYCVKLSKLALIALEALALLCGDIIAQYMTADEAAKKKLIEDGLMLQTVESIQFVLHVLRQWHSHSKHRRLLVGALEHLQSYAIPCMTILNEIGLENPRKSISSNYVPAALDVLCWHWEATVPLLCTRSDVSIRIQKDSQSEIFATILKKMFSEIMMHDFNGKNTAAEVIYAQLRYVCLLLDLLGGGKTSYKVLEESSKELKATLVVFFTHGLSLASRNGAEGTMRFILKVFRTVFLTSERPKLLNSLDEEQELLSQLLRIHDFAIVAKDNSDDVSISIVEFELFVADYVISRNLFITEIIQRIQDACTQSDLVSRTLRLNIPASTCRCANVVINVYAAQRNVSLARILLYQLDKQATPSELHDHWRYELIFDTILLHSTMLTRSCRDRKMLSPYVAGLVTHDNCDIRRLAISCLPSLDAVSCIVELCRPEIHGAAMTVTASVLGYLFATSTQCSFEVMVSWFIDACQFGIVQKHSDADMIRIISPPDWYDYFTHLSENVQKVITDRDVPNQIYLLGFGPNGFCSHFKEANTRGNFLRVLLRKIFGSPRNAALLGMLRELMKCGWMDFQVCGMMEKQVTTHMMTLPRLGEEVLDDNSLSAVKIIEGLMFAWLAPLLVLRMLPRDAFGGGQITSLLCGREDLDHLTKYIQCQLHLGDPSHSQIDTTSKTLFHILARSMVDPVEFKEVKMIATECLSKFPPVQILPFVFAYLCAFLREANMYDGINSSPVVDEKSVPDSCGLVTAKLMVYYLNLVLSGDIDACKDVDNMSKILAVLIQLLGLPCVDHSGIKKDDSSFMDLQRGCIECVALLLVRLSVKNNEQRDAKELEVDGVVMMNLLMDWIFGQAGIDNMTSRNDCLNSRVQELLNGMRSERLGNKLPLPVRLHLCSAVLSAISKANQEVLTRWKTHKFITNIALATKSCSEDALVAESLQIIVSFLTQSSDVLSMKDTEDQQLVRTCFDATEARLKTTECESTATIGLKVVETIIEKFPGIIDKLPSVELQQLLDRCSKTIRDRQVAPVVRELVQSLRQTTVPP